MQEGFREHMFYHALLLRAKGEYRSLARLVLAHPKGTWQERWLRGFGERQEENGVQRAWETLTSSGIQLLLRADADYPSALREIPWPPFGIYVKGNLASLSKTCLAIVGTRKATPEGKECAYRFGRELAKAGLVIVSGLALGIDAASHEGALSARGEVIAALPRGLDQIYPRTHERLAERILEANGAIVSEYPPQSGALPYRFLERNRIVSGLCRGVLFVEAPLLSGALATARFAMEQNREVFVVPGPANHPNFRGSHELIRSGAELVTEPEHILEALGIAKPLFPDLATLEATKEESLILEIIKRADRPIHIDKLIALSNLKAQIVNQALTLLVLKNQIKEQHGGYSL